MTAAEIIEGMLELLNGPERWCKDFLHYGATDGGDAFCVMGALNMASTGHWGWPTYAWSESAKPEKVIPDNWYEAMNYIKAAIAGHDCDDEKCWLEVVNFNNHSSTTYEDLRLVLKEALTLAE